MSDKISLKDIVCPEDTVYAEDIYSDPVWAAELIITLRSQLTKEKARRKWLLMMYEPGEGSPQIETLDDLDQHLLMKGGK